MAQGSRPDRVGEQIRQELSQIVSQQLHDPGIGFLTLTRVKVTPDLQLARVHYTVLGDDKQRRSTEQALQRATPFFRRELGSRMRLRRVPELQFYYDKAIEHQDRIEQILLDLKKEQEAASGGQERQDDTGDEGTQEAARGGEGRQDKE